MKKFGGKIYTYDNRRWELVKIAEGESYGKGFLDIGGGHKAEQRVRADIETRLALGAFIESSDPPQALQVWSNYWFLKEITEPEENEFGEVSP